MLYAWVSPFLMIGLLARACRDCPTIAMPGAISIFPSNTYYCDNGAAPRHHMKALLMTIRYALSDAHPIALHQRPYRPVVIHPLAAPAGDARLRVNVELEALILIFEVVPVPKRRIL